MGLSLFHADYRFGLHPSSHQPRCRVEQAKMKKHMRLLTRASLDPRVVALDDVRVVNLL